ncbi:phage tail fiber domain-containing protein [Sphingomonas sp.]
MPNTPSVARLSVCEFTGDGSTLNWSVSFAGGYLNRDHVVAEIVMPDLSVSRIPFSWVDDSTIKIDPAVNVGQRFRVYRDTPKDQPLAQFSDGAELTDSSLDMNARQAVFMAQEAWDRANYSTRGDPGPRGPAGKNGRDGVNGSNGLPGPRGPQGYSAASLPELRAAPVTDGPLMHDEAVWEFRTGDFSGLADDVFIVQSSIVPASQGAWVRQTAGKVAYQFSATSKKRLAATKISELGLSVRDYGAVGDGVADDSAAINEAKAAAISLGVDLHFPDGDYAHSQSLNFAAPNFRVRFGGKVTLRHTGTGRAVMLDAGPHPALIFGGSFGWGSPPTLVGNANTTDLLYVRSYHHAMVDVRMRDCITGCRIDFAVLSRFRLNGSSNQGALTVRVPVNWLVVDRRTTPEATTDCWFDVVLEGSTGFGMDLRCAQGCEFKGTSEANFGGGISVAEDSIKNTFIGLFCEQNGGGEHLLLRGSFNTFINCSFGGSSNDGLNTVIVFGVRNHFIGGLFHNVTEFGFFNDWRGVQLTGSRNMSGDAYLTACFDGNFDAIPDKRKAPTIISPVLQNNWQSAGTLGIRDAGYSLNERRTVRLFGGVKGGNSSSTIFRLPTGSRPGGALWFKVYNPVDQTEVVVAVAADGSVQHWTGTTTAVVLDGISFQAEA